jgi:hypothetical protein
MNPALIFAAGCSLVLLPVGLRNLAVGREFHLTTSQFGPNFYIGNHAGARGTYESLVEVTAACPTNGRTRHGWRNRLSAIS